jgi:hypothetical protein
MASTSITATPCRVNRSATKRHNWRPRPSSSSGGARACQQCTLACERIITRGKRPCQNPGGRPAALARRWIRGGFDQAVVWSIFLLHRGVAAVVLRHTADVQHVVASAPSRRRVSSELSPQQTWHFVAPDQHLAEVARELAVDPLLCAGQLQPAATT